MAFPVLILLVASAASAEPSASGAASCFACHEAGAGAANDDSPPALGALSGRAIEDALAAYRSGARGGTVMPRIAKGFSDSESRAIAQSLGRDEASR